MTTTAYLELFLRHISDPALLQTFLIFILEHRHDNINILDTLVSRINTPFQVCMWFASFADIKYDQQRTVPLAPPPVTSFRLFPTTFYFFLGVVVGNGISGSVSHTDWSVLRGHHAAAHSQVNTKTSCFSYLLPVWWEFGENVVILVLFFFQMCWIISWSFLSSSVSYFFFSSSFRYLIPCSHLQCNGRRRLRERDCYSSSAAALISLIPSFLIARPCTSPTLPPKPDYILWSKVTEGLLMGNMGNDKTVDWVLKLL